MYVYVVSFIRKSQELQWCGFWFVLKFQLFTDLEEISLGWEKELLKNTFVYRSKTVRDLGKGFFLFLFAFNKIKRKRDFFFPSWEMEKFSGGQTLSPGFRIKVLWILDIVTSIFPLILLCIEALYLPF